LLSDGFQPLVLPVPVFESLSTQMVSTERWLKAEPNNREDCTSRFGAQRFLTLVLAAPVSEILLRQMVSAERWLNAEPDIHFMSV
jgi:hypothetical protein